MTIRYQPPPKWTERIVRRLCIMEDLPLSKQPNGPREFVPLGIRWVVEAYIGYGEWSLERWAMPEEIEDTSS